MRAKMLRATTLVSLAVVTATVVDLAPGSEAAAGKARPPGWIAYASNADGDYEIFVMRPDGSQRRQLTHNEADDFEPSWSPDGRRIVFERERGSNGYEDLYILDVASGEVRSWIVTSGVDEGDAAWSPDGRWIAFRGNDGGDGSDVIAVTVDRKRGQIVSSQDENSSNSDPAWSPDGRRLALVEGYDGSGVYTASVCCSGGYRKKKVTYGPGWKLALDWSPDGSCIVYSEETYTEADGGGADVFTVRADGGGRPKHVLAGWTYAVAGSWSPDGSEIVFEGDEKGSYDVYVMDADGSHVRRVTKTAKTNEISPVWWAPPVEDPVRPECGAPPRPDKKPETVLRPK